MRSVEVRERTDAQRATIGDLVHSNLNSDYNAGIDFSLTQPTTPVLCGDCTYGETAARQIIDVAQNGAIVNEYTNLPFGQNYGFRGHKVAIGPNRNNFVLRVGYNSGHIFRECANLAGAQPCGYAQAFAKFVTVSTVPLKAPTLNEPTITADGKVLLNWTKSSDVPEHLLTRELMRDGVPVRTLASNSSSIEIINFPGNGPFNYSIRITYSANASQTATSNVREVYGPIGIIEGVVATREGGQNGTVSFVRDVEICATLVSTLPGQAAGATYCDSTDVNGKYTLDNIYFGQEATFRIVPSKPSHGFNPGSDTRILNSVFPGRSGVNFTDTTSFILAGRIVQ